MHEDSFFRIDNLIYELVTLRSRQHAKARDGLKHGVSSPMQSLSSGCDKQSYEAIEPACTGLSDRLYRIRCSRTTKKIETARARASLTG